jgi:3-oxoadipate enol-lactonase
VPVAQLNGTSLYYEVQGSGTPIIFIHGHGLTHDMFKPQLDYFSQNYKVILCDLRGNGKSGKLLQSPGQIIETQSLDLIMLMNNLNLRDAVFVGISYGGLIVQHIAKQYPERVRAIVVADSFCRSGASTIIGKLQLFTAYCSCLSYYAPCELVLPSIRLLYRRWSTAYSVIRKSLREKRPNELYRQRLATVRLDYSLHLKVFNRPALCIAGDFTEYGIDCMKDLAAQLPQAKLAIIPDSSDPSNLCQPEQFNGLVRQFLEEQHQDKHLEE